MQRLLSSEVRPSCGLQPGGHIHLLRNPMPFVITPRTWLVHLHSCSLAPSIPILKHALVSFTLIMNVSQQNQTSPILPCVPLVPLSLSPLQNFSMELSTSPNPCFLAIHFSVHSNRIYPALSHQCRWRDGTTPSECSSIPFTIWKHGWPSASAIPNYSPVFLADSALSASRCWNLPSSISASLVILLPSQVLLSLPKAPVAICTSPCLSFRPTSTSTWMSHVCQAQYIANWTTSPLSDSPYHHHHLPPTQLNLFQPSLVPNSVPHVARYLSQKLGKHSSLTSNRDSCPFHLPYFFQMSSPFSPLPSLI